MLEKTIEHAKSSFLALLDPYQSVEKVFPQIISQFHHGDVKYIGVKNKHQIPHSLIKKFEENGYALHTIDKASVGGRALDMHMLNPISGLPMTGSSSGTAVNVLLGINDLGIGTDGGGSVLAPALSVNLYGFISPLVESEYVKQYQSISTDNISFSVSIGFMTRKYQEIRQAISYAIPDIEKESLQREKISIQIDKKNEELFQKLRKDGNIIHRPEFPDILSERNSLIMFLKKEISQNDLLISEEGPIDYIGTGDTIIGHFDHLTKQHQRNSRKGLLRVVNMAGATALAIPKSEFASGYILICESVPSKINKLLQVAEQLIVPRDALIERYFLNTDQYFDTGYLN